MGVWSRRPSLHSQAREWLLSARVRPSPTASGLPRWRRCEELGRPQPATCLCRTSGGGPGPAAQMASPLQDGGVLAPTGGLTSGDCWPPLFVQTGQRRGAFSNTGCARGHLWDLEPSYGFVFKSGNSFLKVRKYLVFVVLHACGKLRTMLSEEQLLVAPGHGLSGRVLPVG